jgi:hypothetical protein
LRKLELSLLALGFLSLIIAVASSGEPTVSWLRGTQLEKLLICLSCQNSIVFNLAIGYFVSTIFWVLVVYLPERQRRRLLKGNLTLRYKWFKETTLQIFSWAGNEGLTSSQLSDLLDYARFRDFYSKNNHEKWNAVLNGLDENEYKYMSELILEIEIFADELSYALNNLSVSDDKTHYIFKQFKEASHRFKNSVHYSYDQPKYVGNFLWGIFSRWCPIKGQRDHDYIQDAIDRL